MMKKVKDDDSFSLISLDQWHALKEHASSFYPQQFLQACVHSILERLDLACGSRIILCCGHSSRFTETFILLEQFLLSGFEVHCIVPKPLWHSFKFQSPIQLHTPDQALPTDAVLLLDLYCALDSPSINKTHQQFFDKINQATCPKIAIELPSGLNADTGVVLNKQAVKVNYTLQSFYHKQGLWTGMAKSYVGQQILIQSSQKVDSRVSLINDDMLSTIQPTRELDCHKGSFKRVVVITGHSHMHGAAIMAAKAALLMGAGLLLMIYPGMEKPDSSQLLEAIWQPLDSGFLLREHIRCDDILLVGPGLGNDKWACEVWDVIQTLDNQVLVDASALHQLAYHGGHHANWIITPHPGEAGVLLAMSNQDVQRDRYRACQLLQKKYGATVVLKGAGTIVGTTSMNYFVCPLGNPGMATPGMGDILSGLIAGLWAQHLSSEQAAILGVWYHAMVGDRQSQDALNGIVLASSILNQIQYGMLGKL